MKKQITIISVLASLCLVFNLKAQNYEWTETAGGPYNDFVRAMVTDHSGNVYYTGYFTGNFDFDGSAAVDIHNCAGSFDFFVVKKDVAGNYLWAKTFGNAGSDRAFSITTDSLDNIIIGGYFQNTLDFDLSSGNASYTPVGSYDAFILKLDSNGDFMWVKTFGGAGATVWPLSIQCDNSGNIVNSGFYQNAGIDADPSANTVSLPFGGGVQDIYIQKLDFNGNYVWSASAGGAGVDRANSMTLDNNGNCYVAGVFQNTVDFNTGAGTDNRTATLDDTFLLKLDAAGNYVNCVTSASSSTEQNNSVFYSEISNSLFLGGSFSGTLDFNYGAGTDSKTATGGDDAFIQKLDLSLNHIWVKTIGGTSTDEIFGIATDRTGNIFSTGRFGVSIDLNPGTGIDTRTSNGTFDCFIQKLDASGNYLWGTTFGGTGQDESHCIAIHNPGDLYVAGFFNNSPDFNPFAGFDNITSVAVDDGFISKYTFCVNTSGNLTITSCTSYTLNNQTYTSSGVYTQTLTNAAGCDSTLTINLTINNATSNSISQTACDSYTLNAQTYTTTGTYTQTLTNAGGCDSTLTINLTINNATSNSMSATACDSYTLNSQTYTTTGTYTQTLTNASGCDSTLNINLTINDATSNSMSATACYSYTLNSQTYTTSGVYTQTLANEVGCDSVLTLNITINTSPVVTLDFGNGFGLDYICGDHTLWTVLTGGSPAGGTWSGTGVSNDTIYPFVMPWGYNYTYVYSYTDVNSCSGSARFRISSYDFA